MNMIKNFTIIIFIFFTGLNFVCAQENSKTFSISDIDNGYFIFQGNKDNTDYYQSVDYFSKVILSLSKELYSKKVDELKNVDVREFKVISKEEVVLNNQVCFHLVYTNIVDDEDDLEIIEYYVKKIDNENILIMYYIYSPLSEEREIYQKIGERIFLSTNLIKK